MNRESQWQLCTYPYSAAMHLVCMKCSWCARVASSSQWGLGKGLSQRACLVSVAGLCTPMYQFHACGAWDGVIACTGVWHASIHLSLLGLLACPHCCVHVAMYVCTRCVHKLSTCHVLEGCAPLFGISTCNLLLLLCTQLRVVHGGDASHAGVVVGRGTAGPCGAAPACCGRSCM